MELELGLIPYVIRRELPGGFYEDWSVKEFYDYKISVENELI